MEENGNPLLNVNEGDDEYIVLSDSFYNELIKFVNSNNYTIHNILLAVFYIVLMKYTASSDNSILIPTVNRNVPGVENIIGMFINKLMISQKIDEEYSFSEFMKQLSDDIIEYQNYQDIPFEYLVDELGAEFEGHKFYFGIQGFKGEALKNSTIFEPIKEMNMPSRKDAFADLTIFVWQNKINFNYSKAKFAKEYIRQIASSYKKILEEIVSDKNIKIKNLID